MIIKLDWEKIQQIYVGSYLLFWHTCITVTCPPHGVIRSIYCNTTTVGTWVELWNYCYFNWSTVIDINRLICYDWLDQSACTATALVRYKQNIVAVIFHTTLTNKNKLGLKCAKLRLNWAIMLRLPLNKLS